MLFISGFIYTVLLITIGFIANNKLYWLNGLLTIIAIINVGNLMPVLNSYISRIALHYPDFHVRAHSITLTGSITGFGWVIVLLPMIFVLFLSMDGADSLLEDRLVVLITGFNMFIFWLVAFFMVQNYQGKEYDPGTWKVTLGLKQTWIALKLTRTYT